MKALFSRAAMALAACLLGERRHEWSAAMRIEFEEALADGRPFGFALGCLAAAARELLTRQEGHFALTSHVLALGLMLPIAALQIGCALFGLPYLFPDAQGLSGAMLVGAAHENLLRGVYQAAIPSLTLLQLLIAAGHVCIAWKMLDSDWAGVARWAARTAAGAATLVLFMSVLFLNGSQALLQGAVLAIELATVSVVARWHAQLPPAPRIRQPG
jgi:hypothetical protein